MSRIVRDGCAIVAIALAALGLSGCTQSSLIVVGSTVTVASQQDFTSLNDMTTYGNTLANANILGAVTSGFTYYDDTPELVRDESFGHFEVVAHDPFTVTYTVNEGVTWSDGQPVDGADLLLAWAANGGHLNTEGFDPARFVDAETGFFAAFPDDVVYFDGATHSGLQYVSALPVLGEDGRSITLVYDNYFVDWQLAFEVGLAAHAVAQSATAVRASADESAATRAKQLVIDSITDAMSGNKPTYLPAIAQAWNSAFVVGAKAGGGGEAEWVTSGPYMIETVAPNSSVTLVANPLYTGERQPRYESVVVRTISDPLEAVKALAAGDVDVISPSPSEDVVSALDAVTDIEVFTGTIATFEHLDLQFSAGKNPTFTDAVLREAFLLTVPTAEILKLSGGVARESFLFPPDGTAAPAAPEIAAPAAPDIAAAKRLIATAGVAAPVVCILFDPSNPRRVAEFELIERSAERAGFVVDDCSRSDWEGFLGVADAYDAALFAWNETTAAVSSPAARLRSNSSVSNYSHYSSETVDALLDQLAISEDTAEQLALLEKIDDELRADFYGVVLYQFPALVAWSDEVQNVTPSPLSGLLWNVWQWQPAAKAE